MCRFLREKSRSLRLDVDGTPLVEPCEVAVVLLNSSILFTTLYARRYDIPLPFAITPYFGV
jgi:hypothetical protein